MFSEHIYSPVDLSNWDVCKPHIKDEKLGEIVLLHVFGVNGGNAIFVTSDDEVYATGAGLQKCLGLGCETDPNELVQFGFSNQDIKCFSSGIDFTIALTTGGRILSCGINDSGQLGIGTCEEKIGACLVIIPKEETVVSIQCGNSFSLALTSSNKVYEWGWSGINVFNCTPKLMSFDLTSTMICQISCDGDTYAALAQNGDMYKYKIEGTKVIVAHEVLAMGYYSYGFIYIRDGNLYQNNELIAEADDFVAKGNCLCFKKGEDFFLKQNNESPKKVDVPNFQSAFANGPCPQFVRKNHNVKAKKKKKIIKNRNLYELFYNKKSLSDVTIKLSNDQIYLQKIILIGLCSHFKQVLAGPSAASNSTELDMTSYNSVAFEKFLQYLYSGIFDCDTLTGFDLIDLYNIADSYFENDLKDNVVEAFKECLIIENVCELYSLADKQMQLVNECLKFTRNNNILAICATNGFSQMESECSKTFIMNCATKNLLN